jgi:flagellar FliJ protein
MFKFELQHVLDYRVNIEEKCQVAYSEQMRCVENERRNLETLRAKKTELMDQFQQHQKSEKINAGDISMYIAYIRRMIVREEEQLAVVAKEEALLVEKRGLLLEAVRNRKAMENLKEKKHQEHKAQELEKERKKLDEFGIVRFQDKVDHEESDHSL